MSQPTSHRAKSIAQLTAARGAAPRTVNNVWRSGKHCVIDLAEGGRFPQRCLFTDEEIEHLSDVNVTAMEPYAWQFVQIRLAIYFGYFCRYLPLKVSLPVAPRWLIPRMQKKRRFGQHLALLSLILFLIMSTTFALLVRLEAADPEAIEVFIALSLLGAGCGIGGMLAGFLWRFLHTTVGPGAALRGKLMAGRYLWLEGASSRFLARLPEWPGPLLRQYDFYPTFSKMLGNVVSFLATFLIMGYLFLLLYGAFSTLSRL